MTETVGTILEKCRQLGVTLAPGVGGKLRVSPPPDRLPEAIRGALRRHKAEVLSALAQRDGAFLSSRVPEAALEAFPDWQGLLVKSSVLDLSVWLVRTQQDGQALAQETGHPAILLDDVLRQRGHTPDEARAAMLPVLISPAAEQ